MASKYIIYEERYTRNFTKETVILHTGTFEEQMRNLFDATKERRKTRDTIRIFLADRNGNVLASTDR
jgi:hypothetical protein